MGKSINTLFLVEDAAWTIKLRRWARLRIWIVAGVSLLLLLQNGATGAQEFDPLLGYLLAADGKSLGLGGDLSVIRPLPLRLPSGGDNPSARGISLSGNYSDYYRPGGLETTGASFGRNFRGSAFICGDSPFHWDVWIRSGQHRWQVDYHKERDNQLMSFSDGHWSTSLKGRMVAKPFIGVLEMRAYAHDSYEPLCALGVDLRRKGAAGIVWRRRQWQPRVDFGWQDEKAGILCYGRREEYEGWLATPQMGSVRAEVFLKRSNWLRPSGEHMEATLEPWGRAVGYHGFLSWKVFRSTVLVGLRGGEYDLRAYGLKGSQPYAKVTAFDLRAEALFASLKLPFYRGKALTLMELERMTWQGYGRGHVEFWPFTSGIVDLLGLRRYFIATTTGDLWRFHVGAAGPLTKRWRGQAGVNIVDVRPWADLSHWKPAFLLFGKSDTQSQSLDIRRFLGGIISVSLTYRLMQAELTYSFTQVVPIKIQRDQAHEPAKPSDVPPEIREQSGVYGGGFHRLNMTWYF